MLHVDYRWDLYPDGILLDEELNTSRLEWNEGDYFKLVKVDGRLKIRKVDPLEQFVLTGKGARNGSSRVS